MTQPASSQEKSSNSFSNNNYDRTAWFYERAANLYSGGQILASKRWQLRDLKSGDKLLFVGAGSGEDVILAAQKGACVTVVELSPKMLASIEKKLSKAGLLRDVELICGDAFEHQRKGHYDMVAANYFLNVFTPEMMEKMLNHLSFQVRQGGKFMIADFAPICGNWLQRLVQAGYYYSAVTAFHLIAKNPLHHIYDYTQYVDRKDLNLSSKQTFQVLVGQSDWYRSLEFSKIN